MVVVKLGGGAVTEPAQLNDTVADLSALVAGDRQVVVVHGGGTEVSSLSERLGLQPELIDGIRQTSADEMDVVDMVLCGLVNKRIVRACAGVHLSAVGLCGSDGGLFTARRLPMGGAAAANRSHTGDVAAVDTSVLQHLLAASYLPVVASPSHLAPDVAININADTAALELAPAMGAQALLFLSDVAGVLRDGEPMATLAADEAEDAIAGRAITGGMIPKVRAAVAALHRGVGSVVVGRYEGLGTLQRMLGGQQGTTIHAGTAAAGHAVDTDEHPHRDESTGGVVR